MLSSDDITVGADAFLERGEQVLSKECVEFVREHTSGFVHGGFETWLLRSLSFLHGDRSHMHALPKEYLGEASRNWTTPGLPTCRTITVMSRKERGSANQAVYGWLCRRDIDDDLEVAAIGGRRVLQEAARALINFERDRRLSSPEYEIRRRELETAARVVLERAC